MSVIGKAAVLRDMRKRKRSVNEKLCSVIDAKSADKLTDSYTVYPSKPSRQQHRMYTGNPGCIIGSHVSERTLAQVFLGTSKPCRRLAAGSQPGLARRLSKKCQRQPFDHQR